MKLLCAQVAKDLLGDGIDVSVGICWWSLHVVLCILCLFLCGSIYCLERVTDLSDKKMI